jgi:hypothetical protein
MKGFALEQLDHLFAEDVPTRRFGSYVFADEVLSIPKQEMSGENGSDEMEKDVKDMTSTSVQGLDRV